MNDVACWVYLVGGEQGWGAGVQEVAQEVVVRGSDMAREGTGGPFQEVAVAGHVLVFQNHTRLSGRAGSNFPTNPWRARLAESREPIL